MGVPERKEEQTCNTILSPRLPPPQVPTAASTMERLRTSARPAVEVARVCNKWALSLLAACDASAEAARLAAINYTR